MELGRERVLGLPISMCRVVRLGMEFWRVDILLAIHRWFVCFLVGVVSIHDADDLFWGVGIKSWSNHSSLHTLPSTPRVTEPVTSTTPLWSGPNPSHAATSPTRPSPPASPTSTTMTWTPASTSHPSKCSTGERQTRRPNGWTRPTRIPRWRCPWNRTERRAPRPRQR